MILKKSFQSQGINKKPKMEYTGLSKRGIELVPKEPNPLVLYLNEYNKDPFQAESNPSGIIDCGVAENDVGYILMIGAVLALRFNVKNSRSCHLKFLLALEWHLTSPFIYQI